MLQKRSILIVLLTFIMLLNANSLLSQDESWNDVNFKAVFESVLQLNIDPDAKVEFGMREINDNLFQITNYPEPVMFSVDATSNWSLTFATSAQFFSGVNDSSLKIPVDFMGYTIESYGTNWDNGNFSNIINLTKDTIIPLSEERRLVLKNGRRNNIGGSNQNFFIIRWNFFDNTDQINISKFSNFEMTDDSFSVGLRLTLAENLAIDPNK
jgi:hypothetical protein